MEKIGIPQSYVTYEYPTSRSKTSKKVTHTAGYLKDIEKILPKSNTYDVKRRIEEYINSLNRFLEAERKLEKEALDRRDAKVLEVVTTIFPTLPGILKERASVDMMLALSLAGPGKKIDTFKKCVSDGVYIFYCKNKYLRVYDFSKMALEELRNNGFSDKFEIYIGECLSEFEIEDKDDENISLQIKAIQSETDFNKAKTSLSEFLSKDLLLDNINKYLFADFVLLSSALNYNFPYKN